MQNFNHFSKQYTIQIIVGIEICLAPDKHISKPILATLKKGK